jgi:hypothetical protein
MAPGYPSERHSHRVALVRPILAVTLFVTVLGLIGVVFVPTSGRMVDISAIFLGLATWLAPLLLIARSWNKKPKSSLYGVGLVIGIFAVTACLSAMGISLALLTLFLVQDARWAWPALLTIAAFWLLVGVLIGVGGLRSRAA